MPLEPGRRVHFWLRRVTLRCILSLCGAPERRFGRPTRWTNKAQRIDNAGMMRLGRPSPPRMAILPSERPGRACGEGPWFSVLIAFARISFMGVRVAPCYIALHGSMARRRSRIGQTKPNVLILRYLLDCDERFVCALCLLRPRAVPGIPDRVMGDCFRRNPMGTPRCVWMSGHRLSPARSLYHDCSAVLA